MIFHVSFIFSVGLGTLSILNSFKKWLSVFMLELLFLLSGKDGRTLLELSLTFKLQLRVALRYRSCAVPDSE